MWLGFLKDHTHRSDHKYYIGYTNTVDVWNFETCAWHSLDLQFPDLESAMQWCEMVEFMQVYP